LKVVYCEQMNAKPRKRCPSPGKPRLVAEDWLAHGLPIEFVEPIIDDVINLLRRVHDPLYVYGIFDGTILNGFHSNDKDIRQSLLFTVGAMVTAAITAFRTGENVAALCSGFHHAHYDHAEGFCTFNGLLAAARAIRDISRGKIGILDCDYHYGNGTDDIIKRLEIDWIKHITVGDRFFMEDQAEEFLRELPAMVESFSDCSVLIYQAGADQYIKDPLGGLLTIEQLRQRDNIVFSTSKIPVCFNLAGGYKREKDGSIPKVLEIHRNTALVCLAKTSD